MAAWWGALPSRLTATKVLHLPFSVSSIFLKTPIFHREIERRPHRSILGGVGRGYGVPPLNAFGALAAAVLAKRSMTAAAD